LTGKANQQRLSQQIKNPLPSPFSPPPGAENLAFLIVDYRTESSFGQHSHERLETTLVYTRLYEPTVASHYYLAMAQIEGRMGQRGAGDTPDPGLMLALVDSLHAGTPNEAQREAAQALRTGILALVEQDVETV
jgi:hypothetical protein